MLDIFLYQELRSINCSFLHSINLLTDALGISLYLIYFFEVQKNLHQHDMKILLVAKKKLSKNPFDSAIVFNSPNSPGL